MKKFSLIFTIFFTISIFGQTVSDFRYIMIPGTFKNEKANRYDLNDLLLQKLKEKKYVVLYENKTSWPKDAVENPCTVLSAELSDVSSSFRNKIQVKLFDCNGKEILSLEAKSNIKDFEPGMQDALKQVLLIVPTSCPKIFNRETTAEYLEKQVETENITVYKNNQKVFKKNKISSGRFTLINMENESIYATFTNSFKKDVFRVEMQNSAKTIGYQENNNLFIEVPLGDGRYQLEEFVIQ